MARASSKPAAYSIRSPLEIVTTGQVERAFDLLNRHAMDRATIEFPVACPGRHIVDTTMGPTDRRGYRRRKFPREAFRLQTKHPDRHAAKRASANGEISLRFLLQ